MQVREYEDWESVIVSAAHSVDRFIKLRGVPICRDQFLRIVTVLIKKNSKILVVKLVKPATSFTSRFIKLRDVPICRANSFASSRCFSF